MGNGYPMDCSPIGKGGSKWGVGCSFPNTSSVVDNQLKGEKGEAQIQLLGPPPPEQTDGPEYGLCVIRKLLDQAHCQKWVAS